MKTIALSIALALPFFISTESAFAASPYLDQFCAQQVKKTAYKESDVAELTKKLKRNAVDGNAVNTLACLDELAVPAIPVMIHLFNESNGEVRLDIIDSVAYLGKLAVPSLIEALNAGDIDIRRGACMAIEKIGPPAQDAIPELRKLLNEPGYDVSFAAAYALGSIGKAAIPTLLEIIRNGPDQSRTHVVENSFRRIKKDEYPRDDLLSILVSPTESILARKAVMQVLGNLGPDNEATVPPLVDILGHEDNSFSLAASRVLAQVGRPAVPAILGALGSPDARVRSSATYAIQYMRFPVEEAIPPLTSLLDDKEATVSLGALMALQRIGTKNALDAVNRFKHEHQNSSRSSSPMIGIHIRLAQPFLTLRT